MPQWYSMITPVTTWPREASHHHARTYQRSACSGTVERTSCYDFHGGGGGFSETVAVETKHYCPLPDSVDLSLEALIEPLAEAWHAVTLSPHPWHSFRLPVTHFGRIEYAANIAGVPGFGYQITDIGIEQYKSILEVDPTCVLLAASRVEYRGGIVDPASIHSLFGFAGNAA
ncbi:hypothetical protein PMIN01_12519 [Paraphaeosphaeria minitans]|uniref:Uncharacterized protein n=1 Tax=Paraphaeosphaeria minitans TaxID=565426 RepID=A0A9P6KKC8_9PLEO|nr:hypothetical protein PMIN01_12519 [Paraphaeosphaeria minitans]